MNDAEATLAALDAAITEAHLQGADLLVLPECAYPAYLLGSVASYRAGGHMSGEAFVRWLAQRAARCRMHIVSGFVDDGGEHLYNAAVLLDDHGREIGRTHKSFLWHLDHDWYAAGGRIRAFDTRLGRIGMIICAETRSPEILATLAADGAELLAMPTCWINGSRTPGQFTNPQIDFLIEARAREFGLPFVCADKSGTELAGVGYVGQSRIVRGDGSLAAEAPPTGEAVISARIEPARSTWRPERDRATSRLLSDDPPVRPRTCDLIPIQVVAIPGLALPQILDPDGPLLHQLREHKLDLLIARAADADVARRLHDRAAELSIRLLLAPPDREMVETAGGRVACLAGRAARSFSVPRAMVLDGAAMLALWDGPPMPILRARALENRVFVATVNDDFAAIIEPDGGIVSYASGTSPLPPFAVISLGEAADKHIAPATDLLDERRPATYRF
jgi:predicted amidohydrolase